LPDHRDRREVVHPEVLLDELARRQLHLWTPRWLGLQSVEGEDEDPAVEGAGIRGHIGFDGLCGEERFFGAFQGDVDDIENRDPLRRVVFEDFEVFSPQTPNEISLRVDHTRADLHVVDLCPERRRGVWVDRRRVLRKDDRIRRSHKCCGHNRADARSAIKSRQHNTTPKDGYQIKDPLLHSCRPPHRSPVSRR
jgi:hypothetical protein